MQIFLFLLLGISSFAYCQKELASPILFLMKQGKIEESVHLYRTEFAEKGGHDFELLQEMGILLLEWGVRQNDPEIVLLSMFGAGLATHERGISILEEGLHHKNPQIQLIALHFLQQHPQDSVTRGIRSLLSSPFLQLRLEALLSLAETKDPLTMHHVEALMSKIPAEAAVLFPQILAVMGTPPGIRMLRKMMHHGSEEVRVAAISAVAKYRRDDLLPEIQQLSQHPSPIQQEVCAYAMGHFGDDRSIPYLERMMASRDENVRLMVHEALYELGQRDNLQYIEQEARKGNLFAIHFLGKVGGTEELLADLIQRGDLQVRVNAGVSLLEHKDPRCLDAIGEMLFLDSRDLIVAPYTSRGRCLLSWRMIPSAQEKYMDQPTICELSAQLREQVLRNSQQLPEKDFLRLAKSLLEKQQNDLIPLLAKLLEDLGTAPSTQLLHCHRQQFGAPWIRHWCTLALYRMNEEGPFQETLCQWAKNNQGESLIQFRPILPWQLRQNVDHYELAPEERSRFLVEVFEALARAQDDQGITTLLEAIEHGNKKNRYALAGLLLRAIH